MSFCISVVNCRAVVSRWSGNELTPADNWEELEDDAISVVQDVGGAINLSGLYPCPPELAQRGVWQQL